MDSSCLDHVLDEAGEGVRGECSIVSRTLYRARRLHVAGDKVVFEQGSKTRAIAASQKPVLAIKVLILPLPVRFLETLLPCRSPIAVNAVPKLALNPRNSPKK